MPYKIEKVKGGFYVVDPKGKRYSKHPLTKQQAIAQRTAININEHRINHPKYESFKTNQGFDVVYATDKIKRVLNNQPQTGLIFARNDNFHIHPLHSDMPIFPKNEGFYFEPLHPDMPIFLSV